MWRYIRDELSAGDTPNVILAHGIPASIFYREVVGHGSTQIISAGNLRNNAYCGQSNRQDRRLLFVSSFPNLGPNGSLEAVSSRLMGYWAGVPITVAKFYRVESVVARIVGEYAERLNLPFGVVGKRPSWQTGEFQYFQDALKGLRWSYFPSDTDDASYSAISDADVLVNVDSTFGYEMMARGVRVAFVTARMPLAGHPEIRDCDFAYPFITSPRGPFWTNDVSQSEIFRVINAVIARPNSEWCTAAGIVTKEIFNYDRGNSILCKVLDELGIQNSGPQFLG